MATVTDVEVANASFPTVRQDLNDILEAIATNFSADAEPTTTYANQFWYETDTNLLKMRNEANDAWITLAYMDQTSGEWELRTAVVQAVDAAGLAFKTDEGTTRLSISDAGQVSFQNYSFPTADGTANQALVTDGSGNLSFADAGGSPDKIEEGNSSVEVVDTGTGYVVVTVDGSETARFDANGQLGIGTTSPISKLSINKTTVSSYPTYSNPSSGTQQSFFNATMNSADSYNGMLDIGAVVGNTDNLNGGSSIRFLTQPKVSPYAAIERMRIDSSGDIIANNTSSFDIPGNSSENGFCYDRGNFRLHLSKGGGASLLINRNTNDGSLVGFFQAGSEEGNIQVSGTTVSYNGGHLSRWSRLADDSKDTSIVKGTVMTNLDAMVVWSHDAVEAKDAVYDEEGSLVTEAVEAKEAYTEDNEQLNKMAVSSVEGDPNVAGVFVNWDEEDDFNDMNIAMTGDMVIRIAQGTTVARGDLLMSAGDGTAKPQGDDIVRSKTIAKVTSTHVSHTYDDGSYLVPCVLMAC